MAIKLGTGLASGSLGLVSEALHSGTDLVAALLTFFAIGVHKADMKILKQISVREPVKLQGLKFREFFQWLSNSMKSASRSNPGDRIQLSPPLGWSEI